MYQSSSYKMLYNTRWDTGSTKEIEVRKSLVTILRVKHGMYIHYTLHYNIHTFPIFVLLFILPMVGPSCLHQNNSPT